MEAPVVGEAAEGVVDVADMTAADSAGEGPDGMAADRVEHHIAAPVVAAAAGGAGSVSIGMDGAVAALDAGNACSLFADLPG